MKIQFFLLSMLILSFASGQRRNVLMICVDDLRPELGCYGVDYMHSPNIDRLAANGRLFSRHYVQAPTCGASRSALLTGLYGPRGNNALFQRSERIAQKEDVPPSMPAWFRQHGYETVSVGKVSHHPGGMGGDDWDDREKPEMPNSWDRSLMPTGPWQHPRGAMHGLAHGEIRIDAGKMDVFQSTEGEDDIYPDGLIAAKALQELDRLSSGNKPFFLAVGFIRPHLPFGAPAKYMRYEDTSLPPTPHPDQPDSKTTWHRSGEFMRYNRWDRDPREDRDFAEEVRRHYAACVSYADAQVGKLLAALESLGLTESTTIVLWGDHGWHLGEHAIWGKHALFEESLRSPLIVVSPGVSRPGEATNAMVETIDVFPTLCELSDVAVPDFIQGQSLMGLLQDPAGSGHAAISYGRRASTIRTDRYRLVRHDDGYYELYDHASETKETVNLAENNPGIVKELDEVLRGRLGGGDE